MPNRNYSLRAMLSIFSTIRTRRMGLWCRDVLLAHHLCSPIRPSRMGSWRCCPGLLRVGLSDARRRSGPETRRGLGLNKEAQVEQSGSGFLFRMRVTTRSLCSLLPFCRLVRILQGIVQIPHSRSRGGDAPRGDSDGLGDIGCRGQ